MALSSRVKNKIVDVINTTFASIGNANGMRMPRSANNLEPVVWDFAIAKHVLGLANKRKDEAEAACVAAGIFPDKEKNPQAPGKYGAVFTGENVTATMEVRSASKRVDADKMVRHLAAAGVSAKLLDEALAMATTTTRPAHVFDAFMVVEGGNSFSK